MLTDNKEGSTVEDFDLVTKVKEVWKSPEIQAMASHCFQKKFVCTPVIMEKVCASGRKCFHDIHYLFRTETGAPIPSDACPINCESVIALWSTKGDARLYTCRAHRGLYCFYGEIQGACVV